MTPKEIINLGDRVNSRCNLCMMLSHVDCVIGDDIYFVCCKKWSGESLPKITELCFFDPNPGIHTNSICPKGLEEGDIPTTWPPSPKKRYFFENDPPLS